MRFTAISTLSIAITAFNLWWALQGLNLQPSGYEPDALPIELKTHIAGFPACPRLSGVSKTGENTTPYGVAPESGIEPLPSESKSDALPFSYSGILATRIARGRPRGYRRAAFTPAAYKMSRKGVPAPIMPVEPRAGIEPASRERNEEVVRRRIKKAVTALPWRVPVYP